MATSTNLRSLHLDHDGGKVRLVQVTDCHLGSAPGSTLLGMDTDHSLQAVVDLIGRERTAIDLILGTGDLSDQGSRAAYLRLQSYFDQLCATSVWLPGNHDARAEMAAVVGDRPQLSNEVRVSDWQILMLDSQIPGEVGGELGADQLDLLEHCLQCASEEGLHTLICLHHQPVAIGCDWLDKHKIADAEEFFALIERFHSVKGILWGHVHQQADLLRRGVALFSTPSTCVQFAPDVVDFKVDDLPPGYRWLDLLPDGTIETGVSRVRGVTFSVELNSDGYL